LLLTQEKTIKEKSFTGHVKANLAIYNEKNKQSQYKIACCLWIKEARKFTFGFKRLGLPKQKAKVVEIQVEDTRQPTIALLGAQQRSSESLPREGPSRFYAI
jgi:hypothetical protein